MKVLVSICLLAIIVPTIESAVARGIAPLGEFYEINLGEHASVVKRVPKELTEGSQTIEAGKDYWTNEKGEKLDEGKVHLYSNGSLVFDKVQKSDYGSYTLPNEPEHVVSLAVVDGKEIKSAVGKSMFILQQE